MARQAVQRAGKATYIVSPLRVVPLGGHCRLLLRLHPSSCPVAAAHHAVADARAPRTPPASPPHGGSVGSGGLKRNSADEGSSRSDILMDVSATYVTSGNALCLVLTHNRGVAGSRPLACFLKGASSVSFTHSSWAVPGGAERRLRGPFKHTLTLAGPRRSCCRPRCRPPAATAASRGTGRCGIRIPRPATWRLCCAPRCATRAPRGRSCATPSTRVRDDVKLLFS